MNNFNFLKLFQKTQLRIQLLSWIFIVITMGVLLVLPIRGDAVRFIWGVLGILALVNISLAFSRIRQRFTPWIFFLGIFLYAVLLGILSYMESTTYIVVFPLYLVLISFASLFYGLHGGFLMALLVGTIDWFSFSAGTGNIMVESSYLLRVVVYFLIAIFLSNPGEDLRKTYEDREAAFQKLYKDFSALLEKHMEVTTVVKELESSQKELSQVLRKKEVLLSISQILSQSLDLKEILAGVLAKTREVVWFHTGGIFLQDGESNELYLAQSLGAYEKELIKLLDPDADLPTLVTRSGKEIRVTDFSSDPRFEALKKGVQVGSAVFIPILLEGENFGCMALWHPQRFAFNSQEMDTVKTIAQGTAYAIRNIQLYLKLDNRLRFNETLWESSRYLMVSLAMGMDEWEKYFIETLQRIAPLFRSDVSVLYRYNESERKLTPLLFAGFPAEQKDQLEISTSKHENELQPILTSTLQIHDALRRSDMPAIVELAQRTGFNSMLWTPILGKKGEIIGGLGVASLVPKVWSKEEMQGFNIFGNFFAITMENLLLFFELLSQRNRLQILLDNVPEGVFTIDLSGKVIAWNTAATKLTGWRFEDLAGKPCSDFLKCRKEDEICCDRCCQLKEGMITLACTYSGPEDIYLHTADNRTIPVATTTTPVFNEEGKLSGSMMVFRDISREKKLEELKDDFFASITHELKTPLASLVGYIELIKNPKLGGLTKEQERIIDSLGRSAQTLHMLIENILESSRIKAGHFSHNPEVFNLLEVLSEVQELFNPLLPPKNLKLDVKANWELVVFSDRQKIKEVIMNLVSNSLEYSPQGGTIYLSARLVGDKVRVEVRDEGPGIPEDKIPFIFDKFIKLEGGRKGTGLGLYIVKKLLQRENAEIKVASSGQGAAFTFDLPVHKTAIAEILREKKVIILAWNSLLSEKISQSLLKGGFFPIRAYTFREGRALLKMENPALFVIDTELLKPEFMSFLEQLKTSNVPFLLIGENLSPELPSLGKDLPEQELLERVSEAIQERNA